MKIQCIDWPGAPQNNFILKLRQHTVLFNCSLESLQLSTLSRPPPPTSDSTCNNLEAILATFSDHGKRAADTQYSLNDNQLESCDSRSIFRTADFGLVDVRDIDMVLISNYELMLGLPYLTEYLGYNGKIIATEPTIEFARQRMEEMVAYHQTSVSVVDPSSSLHFSQLGNLASTLPTEGWRSLYTKKDIVTCIEKIQAVRYEESLSLFSTLRLVAYSSGYCLGSANWLLETGFKKVAFLSSTSTVANRHPAPLDPAIIESADVIILSDLKKSSTVKEKTYEQEMHGALTNMAMALSNGHNAIFCMPTMGPLFDVIDAAYHYLRSIGKEIGKEPYQVPVYVVSPIAYRSLQYANICGEWMNAERQNMLYEPQMPLIHGPLLKSGALQTIHSMVAGGMSDNIREPCIVFTGDSTCISKGSIQWFLRHWGSKEQNACIFTDPEASQALQRDIPANCRMRLLWTPLNARLLLSEMSTLLQTHWQYTNDSAKHILVPSHPNVDPFKEYWQHNNVNVHVYEAGDIVGIELHRQWERISISEQLANTICTDRVHTSGEDNVTYMPVTGLLQMYNHRLELHPLTSLRDNLNLRIHQRRYWDQADLHTLMHRLNMIGIPSSSMRLSTDSQERVLITLPPDMNASILIDKDQTIVKAVDESIRTRLRDAIVNTHY